MMPILSSMTLQIQLDLSQVRGVGFVCCDLCPNSTVGKILHRVSVGVGCGVIALVDNVRRAVDVSVGLVMPCGRF